MDARRWSPLWVFIGGCLSGAAIIGLRSGGGGPESQNGSSNRGRSESTPVIHQARSVEERADADRAASDEPPPATRPARDATNPVAAPPTDSAEASPTDAGNSVADVLARLEAEYRQRSAPARADEPALPPSGEPKAVSATAELEPPPGPQHAVVRAPAPPPEASPSDVHVAKLPAEPKSLPSAANEEPARVASVADVQDKASDKKEQQVSIEVQQLAALQQAAYVQQQYAFLQYQYLQFLPLVPPPRTPLPAAAPTQTQAPNARIVPGSPPSFSATDNPWGFHYPPLMLVR